MVALAKGHIATSRQKVCGWCDLKASEAKAHRYMCVHKVCAEPQFTAKSLRGEKEKRMQSPMRRLTAKLNENFLRGAQEAPRYCVFCFTFVQGRRLTDTVCGIC